MRKLLATQAMWVVLAVTLISYTALVIFMGPILGYNFLHSDAGQYWKDSLSWHAPFHPYHVPGYPMMITLVRRFTFDLLPPAVVMMSINLACLLGGMLLVYRILLDGGGSRRLAAAGGLLFALWPFTGLTYTAQPLADMPALFLFLLGLYALGKQRMLLGISAFAVALLTHKIMWFFVLLSLAAYVLKERRGLPVRSAVTLFFVPFLPLGLLWLAGSAHHHSLTWLLSNNLSKEFATHSQWPLMDGLAGSLLAGGLRGLVKGGILWVFFGLAGAVLFFTYTQRRWDTFHLGVAISVGILAIMVLLNQYEIWAAVRFSKVLVLPLLWAAAPHLEPALHPPVKWGIRAAGAALVLALTASQFAYGWYMVRFFMR